MVSQVIAGKILASASLEVRLSGIGASQVIGGKILASASLEVRLSEIGPSELFCQRFITFV